MFLVGFAKMMRLSKIVSEIERVFRRREVTGYR